MANAPLAKIVREVLWEETTSKLRTEEVMGCAGSSCRRVVHAEGLGAGMGFLWATDRRPAWLHRTVQGRTGAMSLCLES